MKAIELLAVVVLLPFLAAPVAAWSARFNRHAAAWVAGAATALSLAIFVWICFVQGSAMPVATSHAWIESVGLSFGFRLDGLSLLFAGLILVIGLLIVIYARYYLSPKDCMGRFFAYLLMFMGAMLGVVLSENMINLVIFWELTSLASFLLISYWQHRKEARYGARLALAITGAGGLALLGGVLILGHIVGSYELTDVLASGELIKNHELYAPALILILLGVFTKSAQFPFHFWLPNAMAAPTPVSAYLHSATMVKAGIFLLARFFPALAGTELWVIIVSTAGLITFLLGAYTALFRHDLKGLLAYSTISHLGLITLLFGFGTPLAAVAGIFHIINHATFKASLFMVAGIVDHETGTRDMRRLGGLIKYMPHTAALGMIAAMAMAGVPLFNGFLSKEMFFTESVRAAGDLGPVWLLPILVSLGGLLSVAYSLRFVHDTFFGKPDGDLPKTPHEPPGMMKRPVDLLVVLCLAVGILPALVVGPLLHVAVTGVLQAEPPYYSLSLWHGLNLPLLMSAVALIGGVGLYLLRKPIFRWHGRSMAHLDARVPYNRLMELLMRSGAGLTGLVDNGRLGRIVIMTVVFALIAGLVGYFHTAGLPEVRAALDRTMDGDPGDWVTWLGIALIVLMTLVTVIGHRQRLFALISMSVVGLGVAMLFARFSAPDLAMTQLSVEVVTMILLLLALFYLPQQSRALSTPQRRWRDGGIAVLVGGGITALTWAIISRPFESISGYFLDHAVPGGGGHNVVNVILVDFRGYDTFGEITVLALAALGIYAMLHNLSLPSSRRDPFGRIWSDDPHPLLLRTFTQLILPLTLLFGFFVFLRGHNEPGGGFIAGLIVASAVVAQYMANGIENAEAKLHLPNHGIIGVGLLVALGTGLVSMLFGVPFLTSAYTHLDLPVIGDIEIASAIAFDLGVFLVVLGSTVLILLNLGRLTKHAVEHPDYESIEANPATDSTRGGRDA
ncbi:monovalent cation/H+ antiporter subunit A [Guyparkeria sp.]|uniref:monovalent cation/H+ antiporter subunit A n=1 Tax=Guyparkeria sp. TaxID=2035736 RepID=UPI0039709D4D